MEFNKTKLNDCSSLSKQIPEACKRFPLRINIVKTNYSYFSARVHFLKLAEYVKNPKKLSNYSKVLNTLAFDESGAKETPQCGTKELLPFPSENSEVFFAL